MNENKLIDYLTDEKHLSKATAETMLGKLSRYPRIYKGFEEWVDTRSYSKLNSLAVEGYTPEDIYKLAPFLDGIGVFNFLITLTDNPAKGKQIIKDGFIRK